MGAGKLIEAVEQRVRKSDIAGSKLCFALSPTLAKKIMNMLSRSLVSSVRDRLLRLLIHIHADMTQEATKTVNTMLLGECRQPLPIPQEKLDECMHTALNAALGALPDIIGRVRELRSLHDVGSKPKHREDYGLHLLGQLHDKALPGGLDYWERMNMAVQWFTARLLIEQAPPMTADDQESAVEVENSLNLPLEVTGTVDIDKLPDRLDYWKHLQKRTPLLPLPFRRGELPLILLNPCVPDSLRRRCHDLACGFLLDTTAGANLLWLDPTYACELLEVATSAIHGWRSVADYCRSRASGDSHFVDHITAAVRGAMIRMAATHDSHNATRIVSFLKSDSSMADIRKIVHQASTEDGFPVEDWHTRVPAWVNTLAVLGGNLRLQRKTRRPATERATSTDDVPDVLYLDEAAAAVGVSERTIRRWIATKEIAPPGRFDRRGGGEQAPYLFDRRTVEDMALLAKSQSDFADELGLTERALRRRLSAVRKRRPNDTRLEHLKRVIKEVREPDLRRSGEAQSNDDKS